MKEEHTTITVQVQPNASQNKVMRLEEGVWHLKIAAPPIKGKANQELIRFLSDVLEVSKADLTIEQGMSTKRKVIVVGGLTNKQLIEKLESQVV